MRSSLTIFHGSRYNQGIMKYIIGNWKMNGVRALIDQFDQTLNPAPLSPQDLYVGLSMPAPYLAIAVNQLSSRGIHIGAQAISSHPKGAFTGQTSAAMVKDIGGSFSLIGHSERRHHESIQDTQNQIEQCLIHDIVPILCIGETLEDYQNQKTNDVLEAQLEPLRVLKPAANHKWLVAYEPRWAIGSGLTPSTEEIRMVSDWIKSRYACDVLYGGSVTAKNLASILSTGVDGALIGGASLDAEEFNKTIAIGASYKANNN